MNEWFTLAELAAARLPDLPASEKSLDRLARARWRGDATKARLVRGKTKPVWQYHVSLLPKSAQARLDVIQTATVNTETADEKRRALWAHYEALPASHKARCEGRLKAVQRVDLLTSSGYAACAAVTLTAMDAGVSEGSIYGWLRLVEGVDRTDWLAALAPNFRGGGQQSECHPAAWDALMADYLRDEQPSFTSCYRRVVAASKLYGWSPVPSELSLRRRMLAEVPEAVRQLARKGREKAKTLFPAQRRTRDHLHAMQAVNMDGHKLDLFAILKDGTILRPFLLGIQDLYSGKILAWRLCDAENKETVRLVIGDMVERYGIPDAITLDNGRAFASKQISGGVATRYRFKIREEDPLGLLATLGIDVHWTLPYSGQSKPIERAWRDLADNISRHPACAGAYTGNKPDTKPESYGSRAIPIDELQRLVDDQIAEHNSRTGRRAAVCNGRSFDEVFAESMARPETIVRWASPAQRSLWLLAADRVRTQRGSGEVHFYGNRYWHRALNAHAGKYVTVRFDPDRLHEPLKIYDAQNALICEAECIADVGFHDAEAARHHARARNDFRKAIAAEKKAIAKLDAAKLAEIYDAGERQREPQRATPPRIARIVTGNLALAAAPVTNDDDFEDSFSRALAKVGGATIHEFPAQAGNGPVGIEYGSTKKKGRE